MDNIIKKAFSILIAFIIVHLAFTLCSDYQVVSV